MLEYFDKGKFGLLYSCSQSILVRGLPSLVSFTKLLNIIFHVVETTNFSACASRKISAQKTSLLEVVKIALHVAVIIYFLYTRLPLNCIYLYLTDEVS